MQKLKGDIKIFLVRRYRSKFVDTHSSVVLFCFGLVWFGVFASTSTNQRTEPSLSEEEILRSHLNQFIYHHQDEVTSGWGVRGGWRSIVLKEIKTLWKMNLKCILLHEKSHTQNTTCYKILFM